MAFVGSPSGDDSPEGLVGGPSAASYDGAAGMVLDERR
jgi:hypothetical protein